MALSGIHRSVAVTDRTSERALADLQLMEGNLAGHFSLRQRGTEGMQVRELDGCLLVDSGLRCDSFNVLFCRGRSLDTVLLDGLKHFRSRCLPFSAWVGPTADAAPTLERLG